MHLSPEQWPRVRVERQLDAVDALEPRLEFAEFGQDRTPGGVALNVQNHARDTMPGNGPKRLLYVEITQDGTVGGSHQCLYDLVRKLDRKQYRPFVLFYQENRFVEMFRNIGVEVYIWGRHPKAKTPTNGRWWHPSQASMLLVAVMRSVRFLREHRIDLVHLNNSPAVGLEWLAAARLLRRPCIAHARAARPEPESVITRRMIAWFDRVIAISTHVARSVVEFGVPAERVAKIYDGIDISAFRDRVTRTAAAVRQELGVSADGHLACMVGNLKRWKGQHVVLQALAGLPAVLRDQLRVVFVGGTDLNNHEYRESLQRMVSDLRLQECVAFLGERRDVPDIMNASDIVLHASIAPEPFGLVVLEGMALGRVVVAADRGGPVEVILPGSGLMFDPTKPDQLTALLVQLLDDAERRSDLGAGARARAEAFSADRMVRATERVYAELLGTALPAGDEQARNG